MKVTQSVALFRWVCLVTSLSGILLLFCWPLLPHQSVERGLRGYLIERHWHDFENLARESPDYAEELANLLSTLDSVQKNDALDELKRRVFAALIPALLEEGRIAEAVAHTRDWSDFDPRSLNALSYLAYLDTLSGVRLGEGSVLFQQLTSRFPERIATVALQAEALWVIGEPLAAFRVISPYLDLSPDETLMPVSGIPAGSSWWVEFRMGGRLVERKSMRPKWQGGRWWLNPSVPTGADSVTLWSDSPDALRIESPRMHWGTEQMRPVEAEVEDIYYKDLGQTATFSWPLDQDEVRFSVGVTRRIPSAFQLILGSPDLHNVVRQLGTARDRKLLDRYLAGAGDKP